MTCREMATVMQNRAEMNWFKILLMMRTSLMMIREGQGPQGFSRVLRTLK